MTIKTSEEYKAACAKIEELEAAKQDYLRDHAKWEPAAAPGCVITKAPNGHLVMQAQPVILAERH